MNYLQKSLERSRALVSLAQDHAVQLKADGALGGVLGVSPQAGFMGNWKDQQQGRVQYAQFRGWLYAAINALSSEAAGQPVCVGRMRGAEPVPEEGKRRRPSGSKTFVMRKMTSAAYSKAASTELEVLNDHPLLKSLEQPNPFQSRWQFVYSFVANLNLTGWAYVVVEEGKNGKLDFYSLPPTWVRPDHSKGPFSAFKVVNPSHPDAASGGETLDRSQVMFAHLPNPSDPLSALAPVSTQMAAIRVDDHIQTSQERFFENGIFPGVIVTVGKDPHPDVPGWMRPRLTGGQRRQVIGAIRKVMGGVANYGNPAIVDGLIESIERLS